MKYATPLILGTLILSACSYSQPSGMGMNHGNMNHGMMNADGAAAGTLLSGEDIDLSTLPEAKPSEILEVNDGGTINLNPEIVKKTINGKTFAFYGYNGQFPGPTIKVTQGSTFTVKVQNNIDQPTTVHWHGIRLENKFDGAAGVTQEAIEPGGSFTYAVKVPDEGMFWYHPHVREDMQQDLGLYGLLHVTPKGEGTYTQVNREEYIVLDDILFQNGLPVSYGKTEANFALMGRFGNAYLVNGQPILLGSDQDAPPSIQVKRDETVRFYILNAANTRTFKLGYTIPGRMKVVGGDAGRAEQEEFVDNIILAPSERVIVDILFDSSPRLVGFTHDAPGSRSVGVFQAEILSEKVGQSFAQEFLSADSQSDVITEIADFRPFFDKPVDKTIHLSVHMPMMGGMMMDHGSSDDGIEWEDTMSMMNAMATKGNTQWKLIDDASKKENMDIHYTFKKGDKVKIRIINDAESAHPMQHPIHFHGQRFLVLSVDEKENKNLVWKDTVLVPKGATVDILLDVTNPGDWMIHCHIAEHLSNGMMGMFTVE